MNVRRMSEKKLSSFRKQHIGFVFQFHHLLPEVTALENVCMPALMAGQSMTDAEKHGLRLLAMLGLDGRNEHKHYDLSGGEQNRVEVARELVNNQALELTTEPSGNLDSKNSVDYQQIYFDISNELGQTFFIDKNILDNAY